MGSSSFYFFLFFYVSLHVFYFNITILCIHDLIECFFYFYLIFTLFYFYFKDFLLTGAVNQGISGS